MLLIFRGIGRVQLLGRVADIWILAENVGEGLLLGGGGGLLIGGLNACSQALLASLGSHCCFPCSAWPRSFIRTRTSPATLGGHLERVPHHKNVPQMAQQVPRVADPPQGPGGGGDSSPGPPHKQPILANTQRKSIQTILLFRTAPEWKRDQWSGAKQPIPSSSLDPLSLVSKPNKVRSGRV